MDTLFCTAELKHTMMRLKENRLEIAKRAAPFSLMVTIKEKDQTLGLTKLRISISNPDMEIKTIRYPIKLAST